ncbi:MAG: hypothetical protein LBV20_06570 [Treponema sp.]|nr:hypothetical protein [Treponema sp.]
MQVCIFSQAQKSGFFLDPLWSGSWEHEKDIINRLDLKFGFPEPQILFRGQLVDKRSVPFIEPDDVPLTALGAAVYHTGTGSRFLYGKIDETGLSARLKNIWLHGIPLQTTHSPSSSDLTTAPSSTKEDGYFLYLGSPRLGPLRLFSSIYFENDLQPLYLAGIDYYFTPKVWMKIEGLYTEQVIGARQPSTWFSEVAWLPERTSRLYGGSVNVNHPFWGLAGDAAFSETFAFGRGWYGNLAFRLGQRPWRFQAGFDMVDGAFTDREGAIPDNGFRTGMQFEAWGKAGAFFKMTANVHGLQFGEPLGKSRLAVNYYFPIPKNTFVRLSRMYFNLDGNSLEQPEPGSVAKAGFGLYIGPILTTSEINFRGNDDNNQNAFPRFSDFQSWDVFSLSEELQYRIHIWTFRTKFVYTSEEKKDALVNVFGFQFYSAVNWKWGRISGTLRFDNIPSEWTFSIRAQLKQKFLWQ